MDKSRGIRKGCAPAASRHRAASPSGLKAFGFSLSGIGWRGALSRLGNLLFEPPTPPGFWRAGDGTEPILRCDRCTERTPITVHGLCLNCRRVNAACTAIAIIMLGGLLAIYLETFL